MLMDHEGDIDLSDIGKRATTLTIESTFESIPDEMRTIPGFWLRAVEMYHGRTLLSRQDKSLTYAQVHRDVVRWSRILKRLGAKQGSGIALFMGNRPEYVSLLLAIGCGEQVSIPINAAAVGPVLLHPITDAKPDIVVVESELVDTLLPLLSGSEIKVIVVGEHPAAGITQYDPQEAVTAADIAEFSAVCRLPSRSAPAAVLYTSGTTGLPKGAIVAQEYYAYLGWSSAWSSAYADGDVTLVILPLFHMNAQSSLFGAIFMGIEVALERHFSASGFWQRAFETRATHFNAIGMIGTVLLKRPAEEFVSGHRLRKAFIVPKPEPADEFENRFGVTVLHNAYGMTEGGFCPPVETSDPDGKKPGFIGPSRGEFEINVMDDDDAPVASGSIGEIVARPLCPNILFKEYLGRPEETLMSIRNLWFHTGDLGRIDERGNLWFCGRKKESIRRRGENISPLEIEREVLTWPAIIEAAAVPVPSELGEDDIKLAVVVREGAIYDPQGLWERCRETLPKHMWPRYIERLAELPKNASHRILRDAIKASGVSSATWQAPDRP